MTPKLSQDIELMTRVASLYYLDDLTQSEIADSLGLSRPKVGRLLKRAREEGIVEITVHTHPALSMQLENRLKERFNLQSALLVSDQGDEQTQRAQVARMVAGYLNRELRHVMVVAVGMGRNTGAVPEHVANVSPRTCTFVSAIGGSPQIAAPINSNDICRRLAERFGGQSKSLYAPAYAETTAIRDSFMNHDDVGGTLETARQADVALVGIGDAHDDSAVVVIGCFSAGEMQQLRRAGAVGDILGNFFDVNGQRIVNGMDNRVVGLNADDLQRIPSVIGIVSETNKVTAVLGALRSGMVNVLATSIGNARSILDMDGQK
jgi:DNA-binding transcriptional regulator LsrR (DeoR family)